MIDLLSVAVREPLLVVFVVLSTDVLMAHVIGARPLDYVVKLLLTPL